MPLLIIMVAVAIVVGMLAGNHIATKKAQITENFHDKPPGWLVNAAGTVSHHMIFFEQPGTDLCFAFSMWGHTVLAAVPCSSVHGKLTTLPSQ